jgi:RNA polymerase sigma factor (sigma-70 family)
MSSLGSVTHWIERLKTGDPDAAQKLWERYFQQLVALARQRLRGAPRRAADEEDVALSAFESFRKRAEQGRFPNLADRDQLWRLLLTMTVHKAQRLIEREKAAKRGGGRVLDEAALAGPASTGNGLALLQIIGSEPTPQMAAQLAEECQRLLKVLGNDNLQTVAQLRLEGYTVEEIAAQLDCVPRTVQRRLRAIRKIWEQEEER